MRKTTALLVLLLTFSSISFAQSSLLDGKQFTIDVLLNNKRDNIDTLYFENGGMRFATQKKYGFIQESYKVKQKSGGIAFEVIYKSEKNGTMIYEGKVNGDDIEGTLMWEMNLQNPVNYTFTKKEEVK